MPIRKVSYNVEPTRVGESTDFDKLTIELWSNGSMDATEAISQAARQIIEHLLPIAELSGKPMVPAATAPQQPDGKQSSISIEELELSVRAYNCLKRANINSLGELLKLTYDDLMNIKNFGKKSADEVIERPSPIWSDTCRYTERQISYLAQVKLPTISKLRQRY